MSLVVAFFVGKTVIGNPANKPVSVEVVQPISANFVAPSGSIFNSQSIDPTTPITIGNANQQQPFGN